MSGSAIISVESVSKAFEIYRRPTDLLKEVLLGGRRHDLFWALRNVTLQVQEKQRLGIVGPNGAGKSTLLQLITGNLSPTAGKVSVAGKISALLSMTPAWNLEESGLENIRFNLLMQGCDPGRLPALTEEIVEFTELGPFIYRPVKTYSTGMGARLAFAIATAVSPEILIVDEVLGVGDGYFAGKANRRLREMCDRGRALLLVSHSLSAIRSLCDTVLWLENGEVRLAGAMEYVLTKYEEDTFRSDEETVREGNIQRLRETEHLVSPEDIPEESICRLRLRDRSLPGVGQTHYVRAVMFADAAGQEIAIPLHHADFRRGAGAALELIGCEWGRMYSKLGQDCRILSPRTGARKGGHVLLRRPAGFETRPWPLRLTVEMEEVTEKNELEADILDLNGPAWRPLQLRARQRVGAGWLRLHFEGQALPSDNVARAEALQRAALDLRPPVKILDISLISNGAKVHQVLEGEPFLLRVRVRQHERLPATSVNVNIVRSDGVYVFYQPSGLVAGNIENFLGDATVEFRFENNPFGSGDYEANVFVCNGWSWDNIPPSDIYDRSIGTFKFRIARSRPIEFGLVNATAPVSIVLETSSQGSTRTETER